MIEDEEWCWEAVLTVHRCCRSWEAATYELGEPTSGIALGGRKFRRWQCLPRIRGSRQMQTPTHRMQRNHLGENPPEWKNFAILFAIPLFAP